MPGEMRALNALRHRIWFRPNYVAAEHPAIGLQRQSDASRDHAKLLVCHPVAQVQPESPIVAKNPANPPKNVDQFRNVFLCGGFRADLIGVAVIPEIRVRRARDAALHARVRQRRQHGAAIASEYARAH